jgi:alanine racemase
MDQFMVRVDQIKDVELGDEVVLIGNQAEEKITADELAEKSMTINYEIVSKITKRVPRVYIE